jgi:hypothetical protein
MIVAPRPPRFDDIRLIASVNEARAIREACLSIEAILNSVLM